MADKIDPKEITKLIKKISTKHKVPVDRIIVGIVGDTLHVWDYNEGAYEKFKTLEMINIREEF